MSEASVSRNRSTIIVPAGSSPDEGWAAFRNILAEIHEASGLFVMPNKVVLSSPLIVLVVMPSTKFSGLILSSFWKQKPSDGQEHLVDDVGAGFIPGHGSQQPSSSEHNVDRSVDSPGQEETVSKVIRADQKRFFFDLGNNNRGHFLRISEVILEEQSFAGLARLCHRFNIKHFSIHENIGSRF